jgi:large subunit ribosomal protein L17
MRHRLLKGNRGSRAVGLLKLLQVALLGTNKVITTLQRAKTIKPQIEAIITRGQVKTLKRIRDIKRKVKAQTTIRRVFDVLGTRYLHREGGYVRIRRVNTRLGDYSKMVSLEWV